MKVFKAGWRAGLATAMFCVGLERRRNHALRLNLVLLLHKFLAGNLEGHSKTKLSRLLLEGVFVSN